MPKIFTSRNQRKGELGESIAVRYLLAKGFLLVERNYTRTCGEIDIIVRKGKVIRFIEVKSATVSRETWYKPEEGLHRAKQLRLRRVIQEYLRTHRVTVWQIDAVFVRIDPVAQSAKVSMLENIVI